MATVEVVHWNPRRRRFKGRFGRYLPFTQPPANNFGDMLGPILVRELLAQRGSSLNSASRQARVLAAGSILGMAKEGDIVWGSGLNGKYQDEIFGFNTIDVRAVRGPLTRDALIKRNQAVPQVYGDPGLLVGHFWTREELRGDEPSHEVTVVPNLNDVNGYKNSDHLLHPQTDVWQCLRRIAASDFVTGSSLHAIIVAESLGIPARLIRSASEPLFKYEDYYLGSGRSGVNPSATLALALEAGGETPVAWDPQPLLNAFPFELWDSNL